MAPIQEDSDRSAGGPARKAALEEAFLFVHKHVSPSGVRASDLKERRSIHRHAQLVSRGKRRSKSGFEDGIVPGPDRQEPASSLEGKLVKRLGIQAEGAGGEEDDGEQDAEQKLALVARSRRPSKLSPKGTRWADLANHGGIPLPASMNVFKATGNNVPPWLFAALDFWTGFWKYSLFKVDKEARTKRYRDLSVMPELVHGFLSNSTHAYSLAAATAARMYHMNEGRGMEKYGPSPSKEWLSYNAVRSVRQDLLSIESDTKVDAMTLINIFHLYQAELYTSHYEAARTHLKTFTSLVGHLQGDGGAVAKFCRDFCPGDVFVAFESFSPAQFPPTSLPLQPSHLEKICERVDVPETDVGIGFQAAFGLFDGVDIQMTKDIVQDVAQWALVSHYIRHCDQSDRNLSNWLRRRAYSLLSRLLQLLCTSDAPETSQAGDLHLLAAVNRQDQESAKRCLREAVQLASMLWLSYSTMQEAVLQAGKRVLKRLKRTVIEIYSLSEIEDIMPKPVHRDLFLWILFIGAFMAEQTSYEEAWFTSRFANEARARYLARAQNLTPILKRFLYTEAAQGESLGRLTGNFDTEL